MIIDSHVHFGKSINFEMKKEDVLYAMEKYNISKVLASNAQSAECDHNQVILPQDQQVSMLDSTKDAIEFARQNPEKIYIAVWVKPKQEEPSKEFIDLIKNNLDIVKAIKVHPFHSAEPFNSPKVQAYIELAQKLKLPVITHTADDDCSHCQKVYEMALKFPKVKFVMAHLGLGTDNSEAIELCSKAPNLYGDTAWVPIEKTVEFIRKNGSKKLLFGSDMPIDGKDTYSKNGFGQDSMYIPYFKNLEQYLSKTDIENLMFKNAQKLFNI